MAVSDRKLREQQTRRYQILASAKHLFSEKGFESTTVEAIAARAELGKGTIYSYFQSKEEIYIAILEEGLEVLEDRMMAAIEQSATAVEALQKLYDTFIAYHHEQNVFIETLFFQVERKYTFRVNSVVAGLQKKASVWLELVSSVLRRGMDTGEFRPLEIEPTARMIIGMIIGMIIQHEMGNSEQGLDQYRDSLFRLVLEGLKNQL